MVDILTLLRKISSIEKTVADFYYVLHKKYAGVDDDASFLFYKLYLEEKGHASIADFSKKLVLNNKALYEGEQVDPGDIDSIEERVRNATRLSDNTDLASELATSIDIEVGIGEAYYKNVLAQINPNLQKMISAMAESGHSEQITKFAASRGFQF